MTWGRDKEIKDWEIGDILKEMGTDSLLNCVRLALRKHRGQVERLNQQRQYSPVEERRLELMAADEIIQLVRNG